MKVKIKLTVVAHIKTTVEPKSYDKIETNVILPYSRSVLIDYDACTFLETNPVLEVTNIHEHEGGADEEVVQRIENANTRVYTGSIGIAGLFVSETISEIEAQYFMNLRKTVLTTAKG